jgi:hypothetical protein
MPGLPGRPEGAVDLPGLQLVAESIVRLEDPQMQLAASGRGSAALLVVQAVRAEELARFEGGQASSYEGGYVLLAPRSAHNLAQLRTLLSWLSPEPLGLERSFGLGDRLGLATPGHVRALRLAGEGLRPVFAQQSIREMGRTRRSPREVLDDATWGVFSSGWRFGHCADGDHLKTVDDVDSCAAAGFTLFTFDPGDHVGTGADSLDGAELDRTLESTRRTVRPRTSSTCTSLSSWRGWGCAG